MSELGLSLELRSAVDGRILRLHWANICTWVWIEWVMQYCLWMWSSLSVTRKSSQL